MILSTIRDRAQAMLNEACIVREDEWMVVLKILQKSSEIKLWVLVV